MPTPARARITVHAAAAGLLAMHAAAPALAQSDEIQVYDGSVAAPGTLSLTLHGNYTFDGSTMPEFPGGLTTNHALHGAAEWALGLRPWFEAGLYLPLYSVMPGGHVYGNGYKLRALFVKPDAEHSRFFYGVNFEFSDNARRWDETRYTNEIRPIIGWHFGEIDLVFNPILDNDYRGAGNLDFAPSTRLAWHLGPRWAVAAEEYAEFGPLRHFQAGQAQSHQLFGVVDYSGQAWEIEAGLGAGLTDAADGLVFKLIVARDLGKGLFHIK